MMDWTFEMVNSFYLGVRTGAASQGGTTVGSGGASYAAQTGPFICKQKSVTRYVKGPGDTQIPINTILICYQPVKVTDKVWPNGVDQTNELNARPVLSVTTESQLGEDGTVLYTVGFQS
jgi:hypothetical protein